MGIEAVMQSFDSLGRRPMFYRRDGTPYTGTRTEQLLGWAADYERGSLRLVNESWTPYGELVSTVWLGTDQGFGFGPPILFETARCEKDGWEILSRYSTAEEAFAGHERAVCRSLVPPPLRRFFE